MIRPPKTEIDADLCIGCGQCIPVCPSETLSMVDGKAVVTGDDSMYCGHCVAVCPTNAVRVTNLDPDFFSFKTFNSKPAWIAHGSSDTSDLLNLMASRRSCRNYTDKPVDREILEDLVKIGTTAPSGTNSQQWTFHIVPDRSGMDSFGTIVGEFFKRLNKTAEKGWLRTLLSIAGKKQLEFYYRNYYESVKESIEAWDLERRDRLFHGATCAILVGAGPDASCPQEDAMLASQNILLAAHTMGLGSCLIGFAVEAMKNDPAIKQKMGIPDSEKIYAVIALGHPDETFQRPAARKMVRPGYITFK